MNTGAGADEAPPVSVPVPVSGAVAVALVFASEAGAVSLAVGLVLVLGAAGLGCTVAGSEEEASSAVEADATLSAESEATKCRPGKPKTCRSLLCAAKAGPAAASIVAKTIVAVRFFIGVLVMIGARAPIRAALCGISRASKG